MNTVIVPVDFSITSMNAAHYAAKMLKGAYGANLIIYNMYEKDDEQTLSDEQLGFLKKDLLKHNAIRIETMSVKGDDVVEEIERVVNHRHADLVVMGITGKSGLEQVFFGSNTLKLIDKNVCPVLVIPPNATFTSVRNVALTSDFKDVRMSTPSVPIKSVLDIFHPWLHIVNVDSEHYVSITAEYQKERAIMQEMFSTYNPEFYFIGMNDFYEAIEQFIKDKKIDVLITIPRHHSILTKLFKSHTHKLIYHSHVPILAVHE